MDNHRTLKVAGLVCLCCLVASGCNLLHIGPLPQDPVRFKDAPRDNAPPNEFRVSQYLFHADFEVNRNLPIFQELAQLRDQVYRELQLPPANTLIQVYLFEDEARYQAFMQKKYPKLPPRRAFFVAQPQYIGGSEDLLVYTSWGPRVQQDLRHELTHALLHSVLKDVPLWLDEGLAEYFELPPGSSGINYEHLNLIKSSPTGPFHPDLARLERLTEVQDMKSPEYREAWAWVHLMLRGNPETRRVLLGYLRELRTTSQPGLLRPRLQPVLGDPDAALMRHLAAIDNTRLHMGTAQR